MTRQSKHKRRVLRLMMRVPQARRRLVEFVHKWMKARAEQESKT